MDVGGIVLSEEVSLNSQDLLHLSLEGVVIIQGFYQSKVKETCVLRWSSDAWNGHQKTISTSTPIKAVETVKLMPPMVDDNKKVAIAIYKPL